MTNIEYVPSLSDVMQIIEENTQLGLELKLMKIFACVAYIRLVIDRFREKYLTPMMGGPIFVQSTDDVIKAFHILLQNPPAPFRALSKHLHNALCTIPMTVEIFLQTLIYTHNRALPILEVWDRYKGFDQIPPYEETLKLIEGMQDSIPAEREVLKILHRLVFSPIL